MKEFFVLVAAIVLALVVRGGIRSFAQRIHAEYGIHPLFLWLGVVVAFFVIIAALT